MRLVVDANILIGELLRARGRELMEDSRLELAITAQVSSETEYELNRRVAAMMRAGRLLPELAHALHSDALAILRRRVVRSPIGSYAELERIARRRIPRDPDDWPTVALALAIGADIWTLDADFLGCGVATWTTETLLAYLDEEAATMA